MRQDEIIKILDIIATADGGCGPCVNKLFNEFVSGFPDHKPDVMAFLQDKKGEYPFDCVEIYEEALGEK